MNFHFDYLIYLYKKIKFIDSRLAHFWSLIYDTLPYPKSPNNVHLYVNQLQININVFVSLMTKAALCIP